MESNSMTIPFKAGDIICDSDTTKLKVLSINAPNNMLTYEIMAHKHKNWIGLRGTLNYAGDILKFWQKKGLAQFVSLQEKLTI